MRPRDVEIGQTYLVEIPHHLPAARYPDAAPPMPGSPWWPVFWLRGCRFRLTVTDLDTDTTPPMAEGLRIVPNSHVRLDLSIEQVAELGLPAGVYRVHGQLTDINGSPIELPEVTTLRLPIRWLHPADAARPPYTHRDADRPPWR